MVMTSIIGFISLAIFTVFLAMIANANFAKGNRGEGYIWSFTTFISFLITLAVLFA